ncbi:MAG: O-methyltransferase [Deltaproteobacteria bacterium]|nr:O-methyltransferase [Deltaproteobacteria bacterium]
MSQMQPNLEDYFRNFVPRRDALLLELEREAGAEGIPIVGPVVGELLFILARVTGAVNILELGAATGYSALHLAQGCEPKGGRVVTLEWDKAMADRAMANFAKAGLSERIEVRVGDALQLMDAMANPFDFIFMDLDKEYYLPALPHCRRLLKIGGLLFTDNVGFAGAAAFNREIFASPGWRTVHLLSFLPFHSPERDGLSLAVRVK